jgi:hypothetical protein
MHLVVGMWWSAVQLRHELVCMCKLLFSDCACGCLSSHLLHAGLVRLVHYGILGICKLLAYPSTWSLIGRVRFS